MAENGQKTSRVGRRRAKGKARRQRRRRRRRKRCDTKQKRHVRHHKRSSVRGGRKRQNWQVARRHGRRLRRPVGRNDDEKQSLHSLFPTRNSHRHSLDPCPITDRSSDAWTKQRARIVSNPDARVLRLPGLRPEANTPIMHHEPRRPF